MKVYFHDENNRYIGNRELLTGEPIPQNATTEVAIVCDGEEAYLVSGEWVVNKIAEEIAN